MTTVKRIDWIDRMRSLAIALVVVGHAFRGLFQAHVIQDEALYRFIDNTIYLWHMPAFFCLSGYAFSRGGKEFSSFMANALRYIVYPYFLWSVIFKLLRYYLGMFANRAPDALHLADVFTVPIAPFWFLYALFVIQLLHWLLLRSKGPYLCFLVSAVLFALRFVVPLPVVVANVMEFSVFFSLGLVLRKCVSEGMFAGRTSAWYAVGAFAGCVLTTYAGIAYDSLAGRVLGLVLVTASFLGAMAEGRIAAPLQPAFKYIGTRTMPIFCMHILFLVLVRAVFAKLGIDSAVLQLLLGSSIAFIGPLLVYEVVNTVGLTFALGFKGDRRPQLSPGSKAQDLPPRLG